MKHAVIKKIHKKIMNEIGISRRRVFFYIAFFFVCFLSIMTFALFKNQRTQTGGRALENATLDTGAVSSFSQTSFEEVTSNVDLYIDPQKSSTPLYETEEFGAAAVAEFMRENPLVSPVSAENESVQGVSTQTRPRRVLPANFDRNSRLVRRVSEARYRQSRRPNVEHFYYNQQISNIPVYGATARFDVQNGNEIIGVEGELLTDQTVSKGQMSEDEAVAIALAKARAEALSQTPLAVCSDKRVEKVIINKKLLGLSEDDESCETYSVPVCSTTEPISYDTTFNVCTKSRAVIFENTNIHEALNRIIYNCSSGSCRPTRNEGQAAVGDAEVDKSYDIVGDVYNFYSATYQRDSYDGRGATLHAKVHYTSRCPNAYWNYREMIACNGVVANDVWGHELTHGVTQHSAGLMYQNQSGAINEGMSDVFGWAMDREDWNMGEDTVLGILRRLDEPTKITRTPQPDRIFSAKYYCGTGDWGGVHINSGILNKAFYLMVTGGTFNGCTMSGVGGDKALAIMYKALTVYLGPSSNYRNTYDDILKACGDLHTLDSSECRSVKAAMQAVEMDQQAAGTQSGTSCRGAAPKTPGCAGGAPEPTSSISPTTVVPTSISPTNKLTPTIIVPTGGFTPQPGQTGTPVPSITSAPEGSVILNMSIRLQGVSRRPTRLTSIPVKVSVVNESQNVFVEKTATFMSDENGIWTGSLGVDVPVGEGYEIFVKGPMHIQKKFCHVRATEANPGTYRCDFARLALTTGTNSLDFSGVILLSGDLPTQDGIVNSYDISLVRNNLGAFGSKIAFCDVNYDNVCNTQDYSLLIGSLLQKIDEE